MWVTSRSNGNVVYVRRDLSTRLAPMTRSVARHGGNSPPPVDFSADRSSTQCASADWSTAASTTERDAAITRADG